MKILDRITYKLFSLRWNSFLADNPQLGKWMAHYILEWYRMNEKTDSPSLPVDTIVSGRNIFDYADHFYKWNNKHDHNFHSFVLWCIHTKQGQKFIKEAIRNQSA